MASKHTNPCSDGSEITTDLADVLRRCQSGQREAQRQLYERCRHRVYRLMVRTVGSQDAGDLTQQVFLQLFRKIDQFAGRSKFDTWLYRLAMNEALQYLRNNRTRKQRALSWDPMSREHRPEDRDAQQELLEEALRRLEPDLRSIFVLREVEGLSYREIAAAVEIPEGTVGSRLNRARRELQQHLASLGWEP